MRRWFVGICLCVAFVAGMAQENEGAKANALYMAGKKVDALPLYEDLVKAHPDEWLYEERLADCLGAKDSQTSDTAEGTELRTRMRDAARLAVKLGDPNEFVKVMANIDPSKPLLPTSSSPGFESLKEAEKAYGAGDFATAMTKYQGAAEADPQLYEAPLFAGDTAFVQKDSATAGKWFARAIAIDPNRETAYRYWGDSLLRDGHWQEAKEKYVDAVVAEPYNKMSWQGLTKWARAEKAVLMAPKIDRPAGPQVDPKNPKNITINIDASATDDKKHPGGSGWLMYSIVRAGYRGDGFKKDYPDEKDYRHSLKEEDAALTAVLEGIKDKDIAKHKLDESLQNLVALSRAGMLDCWILFDGADDEIAQDYDDYRKDHRKLLHDYIERFVVHGGVDPAPAP